MTRRKVQTGRDHKKRDMLDDLIESEGLDEMSLLDFIYIEEVLNQKYDAHAT